MRKSEANALEWRDVHFEAGEIVVRGDADTGTKNWELSRVPLIPDARALFERMRSERADEPLDAKVFSFASPRSPWIAPAKRSEQIALHITTYGTYSQRAASKAGVDIPTVSRWLGHKDGGALAMKTYGHLRREHSLAQAQRVTFAPATQPASGPTVIAFPNLGMTRRGDETDSRENSIHWMRPNQLGRWFGFGKPFHGCHCRQRMDAIIRATRDRRPETRGTKQICISKARYRSLLCLKVRFLGGNKQPRVIAQTKRSNVHSREARALTKLGESQTFAIGLSKWSPISFPPRFDRRPDNAKQTRLPPLTGSLPESGKWPYATPITSWQSGE